MQCHTTLSAGCPGHTTRTSRPLEHVKGGASGWCAGRSMVHANISEFWYAGEIRAHLLASAWASMYAGKTMV